MDQNQFQNQQGASGQPAAAGQPVSGQPVQPIPAPVPEVPANFQLGSLIAGQIHLQLPPHPETQFDDRDFLLLLAGSISLSKDEKKRIVEAVPKLKQWQVDELMNIFREEKQKFAQLSDKHVEQLRKLEKQHLEDWKDIEMGQQQENRGAEDQQKADEIRKSLGL
ncbi:hypothetical protein KKD70_00310 [Patescibacteria group bacterium]|nr:hypothetical protein [Patescibacteria group bacterium]